MIVNTAGGMAGGDRFDLDIAVGDGARLVVTTAAAEKVYRALGPDAEIDVQARRRRAARALAWLPQETILFDRARLRRADRGRAGRRRARCCWPRRWCSAAPPWARRSSEGAFFDRWRVRRDGRLVFAETSRLDGAIAQTLAEPAVAGGGVAVATVLIVPGDEAAVAAVRALRSISAARSASRPGTALRWRGSARRDGARAAPRSRRRAGGAAAAPLPRLWLN